MIPIFSCTQSEYAQQVHSLLQKGELHARRLYADWFKKGTLDIQSSWIEPQAQGLVQKILACTDFSFPEVSTCRQEGIVIKFLVRFPDQLEVESVLIPMKFGNTLCISSQVGCRMGCHFCETGKMGLIRSLSSKEIVAQVFKAKFSLGASIQNLVFMGMGEPFDNYEAVMKAIDVLTCEGGLGIAPSKITVSTSGKALEIYRFAQEAHPSLKLAVSLNAPNDLIRKKLMPINYKWNLKELKEAMLFYCTHPSRRAILMEYVLLSGVNDSRTAALEVAEYL